METKKKHLTPFLSKCCKMGINYGYNCRLSKIRYSGGEGA